MCDIIYLHSYQWKLNIKHSQWGESSVFSLLFLQCKRRAVERRRREFFPRRLLGLKLTSGLFTVRRFPSPCTSHPASLFLHVHQVQPHVTCSRGEVGNTLQEEAHMQKMLQVQHLFGCRLIFSIRNIHGRLWGWTGREGAALGVSVWSHREDFIGVTEGN